MLEFKCNQNKIRLDKFLCKNLPDLSRSQIQRIIKSGKVFVNENLQKVPHYFLNENDRIIVQDYEENICENPQDWKIDIIFENENYLVINKPAGLIVHQFSNVKQYSLVDFLLENFPFIKNVGEDKIRPGIVHRLDKNVSGLMVVAKNNQAFFSLKEQFQSRKVFKQYLAITFGKIQPEFGEIKFRIGRSKRNKHRMSAFPENSIKGKPAYTIFEVVKYIKNYSLVKLILKTGRTHQARVHLFAFGFPIVGDNVYTNKVLQEKNKKLGLERIFLHSQKIEFYDLNKELLSFSTEMPEDFQNFIKQIQEK